jgi:hypothetical protein
MLRMVEKCTVRHVAVVNVKIAIGCARRRTSAIHVLVILRVTVLSRIAVKSMTAQHAMVVMMVIWSLSRMV